MNLLHRIGLALDRSIVSFDDALGRIILAIRNRLPDSSLDDDPPEPYGGEPGAPAEFYRARLVTAPGASLPVTEAYEAYCDWCMSVRRDAHALPSFGRRSLRSG